MKKLLAVAALFAVTSSTLLMASETPIYVGGAYGYEKLTIDRSKGGNLLDEKFGSIMIDGGYKVNPYIAVEARYWFGINSSNTLGWRTGLNSDITVDAWGIYAKPMYPVTDAMNIYGLVGYGSADATYDIPNGGTLTTKSTSGLSWGIGADYTVAENWEVFIDYTSIVDGESGSLDAINTDDSLNVVNIGVNYKF